LRLANTAESFRNRPIRRTIDDHPGVGTIAGSHPRCKKGVEPFPSARDSIIKGKKLSVYRADLSRTFALVAALLLTAASTSVFAREFRAADTQREDYPTVQALRYMGHLIVERSGGRLQIGLFHSRQLGEERQTIEQARVGAIDLNRTKKAQRDPGSAALIERIRKAE
jgi:Bacterial extracellular solute-binding protein, family 7